MPVKKENTFIHRESVNIHPSQYLYKLIELSRGDVPGYLNQLETLSKAKTLGEMMSMLSESAMAMPG